MKSNNFRYDINGLRAYAVILVVLFHFGITGFAAGFIGVDIFFVISGFLMTTIVIKSLEKGNFSLLNFYLARGIRIIPALFVVSTIVLILGWFFLLPTDYKVLAKHTLSSINFFSNIVYWRESGYFDTDSHNKALLHTWSLSVEWQFYLVFPIVIALLYKINKSRKFLLTFLILGTIFSFILSIIVTAKNPSTGFFLLPTRAWEMLIGGLILFIPKEKVPYKKPLEFLGFSLIAVSCYIFSTNTLWPSYNALLPALGTFLILLAHQQNSIFTKGSVFQWLGNNSYSIYLWHWPIVFFLHYFYKNDDYLFIASGIALSIILGWISYTYIENPTRKKLSNLSRVKSYVIWFSSITVISLISIIIFKFDGISKRFSNDIQTISDYSKDINPRKKECHTNMDSQNIIKCSYGEGKPAIIVIGDSHADALLNGVLQAAPPNTSVITYTISGCSTISGLKRTDLPSFNCGNLVDQVIKSVDDYSKAIPILLVNRLNLVLSENSGKPVYYINKPHKSFNHDYFIDMQENYLSTLQRLSDSRKLYITRSTPELITPVPNLLAKIKLFNLPNNIQISYQSYLERNKYSREVQDLARIKYDASIIEIDSFFCDSKKCDFTKNGKPLFFDADHMSWSASALLAPIFRKEIFNK